MTRPSHSKKRTRAPARKPDADVVILPDDPWLNAQAASIRRCAANCFDNLVEIGERLIACRARLKKQREWLTWLKAEFRWSRRHADRFIAVAKNKAKCASLRTLGLPVSAIYLLAKASPAVVQTVERRVAAGEPMTVRDIQQQVRAERGIVVITDSSSPRSGPALSITATPQQEPKKQGTLTNEDLHREAAADFPRLLAEIARHVRTRPESELIAEILPPDKRTELIKVASDIIDSLNDLKRALWDAGRPKLVSDDGDGGAA